MEKKMKSLSVVVFVLAGLAGWYLAELNKTDVIYVDLGNGRGPAAIRQSFYVGGLNGLALSKKIHDRVVGDAHILNRDGEMGIELGQFVTEDKNSRKVLACSLYDRVELQFIGEGVASHGESPRMVIQSDCRISTNDIKWMEPIWVPTSEILSQPTSVKQMSFLDKQAVSFQFTEVGDEWPVTWVLESLRLYNSEQPEVEVAIDRSEIRQVAPNSIILEWSVK